MMWAEIARNSQWTADTICPNFAKFVELLSELKIWDIFPERIVFKAQMPMYLMVVLLLGVATIVLWQLLKYLFSLRRLPPGPWGLPLLGYLHKIDYKNPYITLTNLARLYGPIYSIQMGKILTVVISDHRLIKEAFNKDEFTGRADLYLTHGIMQGYGLICAEGERWKEQRKFVAMTLKQFGMVKSGARRDKLEARIMEGVKDIVQYLKQRNGDTIDISRSLLHAIGNVMNSIVFGRRWSWDDATWRWLQHLADDGVKHIGVSGPLNFLPFLRYLPRFKATMNFLMEGKKKTHRVYQEVIDTHEDESSEDFVMAFSREMDKRGQNQGSFNQQQFYHLLGDLFGAGTDTTLTTLRWFLIYVALYPDVQERIQSEISSVCDGEQYPQLSLLVRLPYLEASIAEAQRIRTVTPVGIPHGAKEEGYIGGYRVPKRAMIMPLQWAVHMDPKVYPDPENFIPERFIDSNGQFYKPDAFVPFQLGKRMCVGEELARMILILFASSLLHHFTVTLPEDCADPLESECGITLVPTLREMRFKPRRKFDKGLK